uniref:Mobile element protein n=1 Tax=Macrostomum lignano TaxID=282301 RepID=A0A1I8GUP6_9PLAT
VGHAQPSEEAAGDRSHSCPPAADSADVGQIWWQRRGNCVRPETRGREGSVPAQARQAGLSGRQGLCAWLQPGAGGASGAAGAAGHLASRDCQSTAARLGAVAGACLAPRRQRASGPRSWQLRRRPVLRAVRGGEIFVDKLRPGAATVPLSGVRTAGPSG